ncbi:MAG: UDP-2,3-diacylglucosamine diphosphatase LpxI [Dinoroseobacter sp.]|nr:UDP-2,3-diacylglucosamine diphosphatase LpxI [Dinoroseobacter sp.]
MLALIAGKGELPLHLSEALRREGSPHKVLSLEGFEPNLPDVTSFRVEDLGQVLSDLADGGAREICFAGAMQRPPIDPGRLHPLSLPLVPRLMGVLQEGDDRLLREVIAIFEEAGLKVRGAAEIAPELTAPDGAVFGKPGTQDLADAEKGRSLLASLSPHDIGQGCVIAKGHCLGIETLQGTDAMLGFVAGSRAPLSPPPSGVFIKRAKVGQDLRIDMPAIGPETVRGVAEAGLTGICLEAGRVLLLDRETVVADAAKKGIAIWGIA